MGRVFSSEHESRMRISGGGGGWGGRGSSAMGGGAGRHRVRAGTISRSLTSLVETSQNLYSAWKRRRKSIAAGGSGAAVGSGPGCVKSKRRRRRRRRGRKKRRGHRSATATAISSSLARVTMRSRLYSQETLLVNLSAAQEAHLGALPAPAAVAAVTTSQAQPKKAVSGLFCSW